MTYLPTKILPLLTLSLLLLTPTLQALQSPTQYWPKKHFPLSLPECPYLEDLSDNAINCVKFSSAAQFSKQQVLDSVAAIATLRHLPIDAHTQFPQHTYLWAAPNADQQLNNSLDYIILLGQITQQFSRPDIEQAYDAGALSLSPPNIPHANNFWKIITTIEYRLEMYHHIATCTPDGYLADLKATLFGQ